NPFFALRSLNTQLSTSSVRLLLLITNHESLITARLLPVRRRTTSPWRAFCSAQNPKRFSHISSKRRHPSFMPRHCKNLSPLHISEHQKIPDRIRHLRCPLSNF